jgi:hypothetical protein
MSANRSIFLPENEADEINVMDGVESNEEEDALKEATEQLIEADERSHAIPLHQIFDGETLHHLEDLGNHFVRSDRGICVVCLFACLSLSLCLFVCLLAFVYVFFVCYFYSDRLCLCYLRFSLSSFSRFSHAGVETFNAAELEQDVLDEMSKKYDEMVRRQKESVRESRVICFCDCFLFFFCLFWLPLVTISHGS